jgi:hypothetical protein
MQHQIHQDGSWILSPDGNGSIFVPKYKALNDEEALAYMQTLFDCTIAEGQEIILGENQEAGGCDCGECWGCLIEKQGAGNDA